MSPQPDIPSGTVSAAVSPTSPATTTSVATPRLTVVRAPAADAPSKARVLLDQPKMVLTRPEDQPYAPEAFVVRGDTVTIADRVNKQIVTFQNGRRIGAVAFPDLKLADMAIRDGHYYFLNALDQREVDEFVMDDTRTLTQVGNQILPAEADRIGWDDGRLVAQLTEQNTWVAVDGSDPVVANPTFELNGRGFRITDGHTVLEIPTRYEPTGVELIARDADYTYYQVYDNYVRANAEQVYRGYVYQFDRSEQLVHTYTLHVAADVKPSRELQIVDGRVYQLFITNKTARVLLLAPN
ncbi:hypothetical protein [Propionicimonas paludicola]|uniref:hypothetical protein n=1 Tax=Propionicimonas paludicola TaxID=185243 RepID=UPI00117A7DD0|nr:hypothetical protein [Propionicimonas paludicola]